MTRKLRDRAVSGTAACAPARQSATSSSSVAVMIRSARLSDAPRIGELQQLGWRQSDKGILPDAFLDGLSATKLGEDVAKTIQDLPVNRSFLVKEDAGAVVGALYGGPVMPTSHMAMAQQAGLRLDQLEPQALAEISSRTFEVYIINVHPNSQHRGVGR